MCTKQETICNDIMDYFLDKFGRSGANKQVGTTESIYLSMERLAIVAKIFDDGNVEVASELCVNGMSTGLIAGRDTATDTAEAIELIERIIQANDILVTRGDKVESLDDLEKIAETIEAEADSVEY